MKIYFAHGSRVFGKQEVPIWAEVTAPQVQLDPPCIDLGIAMMDVDVCQQNFNIVNSGHASVQVSMKTPKRLGNQVTVHPKSTILQSDTFCPVSVRLEPESSILQLSKSVYDPVSSMLEFPVQVQTGSREAEKPPPLILKVLATLTTCRGLILEPAYVNLGTVHTHESVCTEILLTNDSLLIQEYGFLFLPMFMEVQPNDGFGSILPGETIKLHLIYSARCTDIPGNETGANGLAEMRSFQIQVVTLAELASHKKDMRIGELKDLYDREKSNLLNRGISPPLDREPTEIILNTDVENHEKSSNFADRTISDVSADAEVPDAEEIVDRKKLNGTDKRLQKNLINIHVHIVDTFCEMSEQILEFPATPCGSFSAVASHV
ncbi:cilia- and flagella-associated protein 74 [Lasioglossum baleicum]|uniref:cilia- and flagella-associated protein 74 n=1 Tax=Lasioglossum baleicum TaxID=434251 RepID=UPI003FCED6D4